MSRRLPMVTITVTAGALFIAAAPALQQLFIYDRERILAGELWRLVTGHFVHLSRQHLLWDITAFAIIGLLIEVKKLPAFVSLCLIAPFLISALSICLEPNMRHYAGLSALAMAALVFFAVHSFRQSRPHRAIGLSLLTLAAAKITFELTNTSSLFIHSNDPAIRVAVVSHLTGALIGAIFALPIPACVSSPRRAKQVRSESPHYSRQV